MNNSETISLYDKLVDEFDSQYLNKSAQVSPDLLRLKQSAFEVFKSKGFPTVKDEEWRFTNIQSYLHADYELTAPETTADVQQALQKALIPGLDAYLLVLIDGRLQSNLSKLPHEEMVSIKPVSEAKNSPAFTEALSTLSENTSQLTALNTALFADGLYINVKAKAVLDKPILIIHLYSAGQNTFVQPRHLIVVNELAKAEIFENSASINKSGLLLVNSVTSTQVKENAYLVHYQLQSNEAEERYINHSYVTQKAGSRYDNFTLSLPGADLLRNNLDANLNGTATETHLYGLYLVAGTQLTDNHTAIHHNFPHCQSNEIYKGVLTDYGRGVFNGKVFVDREAQKTNAFQQNNNLLLSNHAKVNTKPQLEIFADDVKCSHGCTVGQFNPDSLFYLQSRGIGIAEAKKLLVEAFLFDVTEKIGNTAIKKHVQQLIYAKLENA